MRISKVIPHPVTVIAGILLLDMAAMAVSEGSSPGATEANRLRYACAEGDTTTCHEFARKLLRGEYVRVSRSATRCRPVSAGMRRGHRGILCSTRRTLPGWQGRRAGSGYRDEPVSPGLLRRCARRLPSPLRAGLDAPSSTWSIHSATSTPGSRPNAQASAPTRSRSRSASRSCAANVASISAPSARRT